MSSTRQFPANFPQLVIGWQQVFWILIGLQNQLDIFWYPTVLADSRSHFFLILWYMVRIEALSNLEFQGVPCQHGQHREEHRVGPNRSPKYPWVSAYCPPCSKWTIKMCLCDHESPVGNPLQFQIYIPGLSLSTP